MILIFYEMIMIPVDFSFEIESNPMKDFDFFFVNSFFILDIFVNFNTGYYSKGLLIMERKRIFVNYLKGAFAVDLVASIPYTWIVGEDDSTLA